MILENEFRDYLVSIQKIQDDSAQSYTSTLRNNLSTVLKDVDFNKIVSEQDLERIHEIQLPPFHLQYGLVEKTFANLVTHFNRYKEFLIYYIEQEISEEEILEEQNEVTFGNEIIELDSTTDFVQTTNETLTYSKKDIEQNFYFRLITQNRFNSSGLFFPISFLKQYFYKTGNKAYFDKVIENQINNIEVVVLEGSSQKTYRIKDLKSLTIKDGFTFFNDKPILSENFDTKDYKKLQAVTLKNIAIDHIKSISEILKQESKEADKFPQLLFISKSLRKYLNKPITYKKLTSKGTKLSNDISFRNEIDQEKLKSEFEYLVDKMSLRLMCSKDNGKKRDK